jgi:hypothetical protein
MSAITAMTAITGLTKMFPTIVNGPI